MCNLQASAMLPLSSTVSHLIIFIFQYAVRHIIDKYNNHYAIETLVYILLTSVYT